LATGGQRQYHEPCLAGRPSCPLVTGDVFQALDPVTATLFRPKPTPLFFIGSERGNPVWLSGRGEAGFGSEATGTGTEVPHSPSADVSRTDQNVRRSTVA